MIQQDSILTEIKDIQRDTLQFKTAQPFFNGQYGMKLLTNDNSYDTTVSLSSAGAIISGNVVYLSNSQMRPFCSIIAVLLVNGSPLSISQAYQQRAYRVPYGNENEVQYRFNFSVNMPAGTIIQVKAYAIASDNGTLNTIAWTS